MYSGVIEGYRYSTLNLATKHAASADNVVSLWCLEESVDVG